MTRTNKKNIPVLLVDNLHLKDEMAFIKEYRPVYIGRFATKKRFKVLRSLSNSYKDVELKDKALVFKAFDKAEIVWELPSTFVHLKKLYRPVLGTLYKVDEEGLDVLEKMYTGHCEHLTIKKVETASNMSAWMFCVKEDSLIPLSGISKKPIPLDDKGRYNWRFRKNGQHQ